MGLSLLAAFPVLTFAQQPQADCPGSLRTYVGDRSLNARWGDAAHTYVIMVRGGVEYVCKCPSNTRPPVCSKKGSSGSGGLDGVDLSQFSPGQQLALMATQSLLQGLFAGIFSGPSKPAGPSPEEILRQQQEMLQKQEEERQQALESWNLFREEEAKRIEAEKAVARASGDEMLGKMGSSAGQGLGFESVGGQGLDFQSWVAEKPGAPTTASGKHPAPKSAAEQARCAAAFSDEALRLDRAGKHEEARFMSLQAQKAMAGGPTDVPCPAAGPVAAAGVGSAGPQAPAVDVDAVLDLYNARIKDLFALSQKLADVRKQKIDAQLDFRQAEARIAETQAKAATVTKPEEKKEVDDLLGELQALKADAENRQKIAEENENACLADAKKAEDAVKELDAKLKSGQGQK
jgi:hypothetical protein